jgi:tetratricopeptide (TPR) repeat protein
MLAQLGRFEEAEPVLEEGRAAFQELGVDLDGAMVPNETAATVRRLAGDEDGALACELEGLRALEALGEKSYASTVASYIADIHADAGRVDDALRYSELCREYAIEQDLASQVGWRCASAKALARRGDLEEAELLARQALALGETTDFVVMRTEARLALAEVCEAAGRSHEAERLRRETLAIFEAKGNLVMAARVRAGLGEA